MIRVMLVEDEMLVIEGLRRMIQWEAYGFTIVAEASNGEDALEKFKQFRPDVLFTDIRMPIMDGMTLIAHIRELSPKTPVCVLSSHTDFNLVQQGIRNGVFEYLDKLHLSSGEIEQCLRRLKDKLEQSNDSSPVDSKPEKLPGKPQVELSPLTWLKARQNDAPAAGPWCWVIGVIAETNFYPWEHNGFIGDFPYEQAIRQNRIFLDANKRIHMVLHAESENPEFFQTWFNPYLKCAFAVSDAVTSPSDWEYAYRQAEELLTGLFYKGWNQYLTLDDQRIYHLDLPVFTSEASDELLRLLSTGRAEASIQAMEQIVQQADLQGIHPRKLKQAVTMMLFRGVHPAKSEGGKTVQIGDKIGELNNSRTRQEFMSAFAAVVIEFVDQKPQGFYSEEIIRAINYMKEHMTEKITLGHLAEVTHLHPNYFATLFKEQTGEPPMGHLTSMRINRAKELLLSTNLYIQEVAEQVGFVNLSHFSRLFKQITGRSPSEYRQ